jgi:multisubunit Na+/H+ antiporter MnhB subunit
MVAVVLDSTREELNVKIDTQQIINMSLAFIFMLVLIFFFMQAIETLNPFGEHSLRMASAYVGETAAKTGSANLVTGVLFDFRGYDTLGEATILFSAAIGVLTILRIKGKK